MAGACRWLEKALVPEPLAAMVCFFMRSRLRVMEETLVGRKRCLYLAVCFNSQMINATCAQKTHTAFLPKVAGPQPSPGLREPR